jgi:hypothetical protein
MALGTYADLLTEVQAVMARTDALMVARFPTWMLGAEQRIYVGSGDEGDPLYTAALRCQLQEVTAALTIAAGVATLPADYLEQRAIYIAGQTEPPAFEPPQRFFTETQNAAWKTPSVYTIVGNTVTFTGAYTGTATLIYFKSFPAVSAAVQTNALLTAYPIIWLYALLIEAYDWSRNTAEAGKYIGKLRAGLGALNGVSTEQRYGGPSQMTLRIDPIG